MQQALATLNPSAAAPSIPSSKLSPEGLAKAMRLLGNLEPVTAYTRLISPVDADRIVTSVEADLAPCTRSEAATLVAELIGAYPDIAMARRQADGEKDFKLYSLKLYEAFAQFSFAIGKAIVNGGSGVPAICPYKPKPADVVAFGAKERDKRLNTKTMAQRHKAEAQRREAERAEHAAAEKSWGTPEQRKAKVDALMASFRATA